MSTGNPLTQHIVDLHAEEAVHELYEKLERKRPADQPPSEIAGFLRNWDLDDHYKEWFETGDEEWS